MKQKILAGIALVFMTAAAGADGIAELRAFNQNIESLSGNFSQTVKNAKKTQKTSGTFAVLRPGSFKWQYTQPYRQLITGNGQTVWLYDEDLAQATRKTQGEVLGASPAAILADKTAIETRFTLQNDGEKDGIAYVNAIPKGDSEYRSIRIGLRNGVPAAMQLEDGFGNHTSITFSAVRSNPDLPAATFQFTPPAGVDVLEAD